MVPHAADAPAASVPSPKIFQLSPLPGNIYETDRFYYDPAATLDSGAFGALLAFATAHGHPFVVHDCHDLQEFHTAHPTAVVRPIAEVSPAIVARGLSLLAPPTARASPRAGSHALNRWINPVGFKPPSFVRVSL